MVGKFYFFRAGASFVYKYTSENYTKIYKIMELNKNKIKICKLNRITSIHHNRIYIYTYCYYFFNGRKHYLSKDIIDI